MSEKPMFMVAKDPQGGLIDLSVSSFPTLVGYLTNYLSNFYVASSRPIAHSHK